MLGAWWQAPLARQFAVSSLGFVLTTPVADVEAPIARFRRAFALVVTLTVALILWVSLRQIRHTLSPLERLRQMAEALQGGRFDARVTVASDDEFAALGASFNIMAEEVQRTVAELKALNVGTLEALARAIDAKSPWTAGHSQRVTSLGVRIGRQMGLTPEALEALNRGGLLHDIGKLGIPSRILDKPAPLTEEEFAIMRQHPALGARILEPVPQYAPVLPIVLQHHERYDGSGYPHGLAGDAIDLGARIFAVADVVDAMSSTRPYRNAIPMHTVVGYIRARSGHHFDPKVVDAFLRVVEEEGLLRTPEPLRA
jgi:putative nucleotidyltransferase with HDIG domain